MSTRKKVIFVFVIVVIFFSTVLVYVSVYGRRCERMETLFNEGMELYNHYNFRGAAQKWEQALEIARSKGNKGAEGLLLRNLGLVYTHLADYPKAIPCYEQALEILRELGDQKKIRADLTDLGNVYRHLGNYSKAISYYEQALEICRDLGDKRGIGIALTNLGNVYSNLSDYPKAISYYEQALEIDREIEDKKGIAAVLTNLGAVYIYLGDYSKALSYHEQALEIRREIGDKKGIGADLGNLGIVYWSLGDYQKAISYHEQALEIHKEIGDKKGIGGELGNLGIVYKDLGDYPKAISYHEQALEIRREIGDKKGIGIALGNLGIVYYYLGDYSKALSYYEQALEIKREIGDKEGISADLINLGVVYSDLSDYPKALSYYEQALKIQREIGVPIRRVGLNLADIWLKKGEIEKAERAYLQLGGPIRLGRLSLVKGNYRKAIEYFDKSLKENLQSRNAILIFVDHVGLGQAYERLKEYGKAKEFYEKAATMAEEQREALAEAEKSRFFVAEIQGFKRIQPYERMVPVLIAMDDFEEAFLYSENLKARVLAEAIARGRSHLEQSLPSGLAEEENTYIRKIRGLRRQMETLYRNKAMDTYYKREKELIAVKEEQKEFIHRLRESHPEYASINYPQPIKPLEVKLAPKEVLIEFEVTDEASYVFMLKNSKLKIREVPISREELQELVGEYRSFFEGTKGIRRTDQLLGYRPEVGQILYRVLFGDLLQSVPKGSSLIIVPDEFLGILPFEALVTGLPPLKMIGEGKYGPFPLEVKYLEDKYLVSYAQSATALTLLRTPKRERVSGERILVIADPIFSDNDARLEGITWAKMSEESLALMGAIADWKKMSGVKERKRLPESTSVVDVGKIFPRLPKTGELAREMGSLFGRRAQVLQGLDAREDQVVESLLSPYRYLLFATHGILDQTVPRIREPALALTQVGNPKGYDGFLTMTEIMGLKLEAEVTALTACQTGVGEHVTGEGVMGMGRAFQFAGSNNVLVSLWSVAEASATQFTSSFFKYLRQGKEPREAMRLARSQIRRQGYEHPFYWAAFILVGR